LQRSGQIVHKFDDTVTDVVAYETTKLENLRAFCSPPEKRTAKNLVGSRAGKAPVHVSAAVVADPNRPLPKTVHFRSTAWLSDCVKVRARARARRSEQAADACLAPAGERAAA